MNAIRSAGSGGRGSAGTAGSYTPPDLSRPSDRDGQGSVTIIVGGAIIATDEAAGSQFIRAINRCAGRDVLDPRLLTRGVGAAF